MQVEGRAVRAYRLVVCAHFNIYMRMIERGARASAHEFFHSDANCLDARVVLEVRYGMIRHLRQVLLRFAAIKHVRAKQPT